MTWNLTTLITGLYALGCLAAIACLAALGHPVPAIIQESLVAVLVGHFAVQFPASLTAPLSGGATPNAPPTTVAAVAAAESSPSAPVAAATPVAAPSPAGATLGSN